MKATQPHAQPATLVAEFTVPGEPVSKSRARFTKRGSKTVAYTPERTKEGEERVAWSYRSRCKTGVPTDPEIAYRVEARFYNGTRQRRDVDNMVKLVLDGLNGVAWVDDDQVLQIEATKSWVPKDEARTEVRIFRIGTTNPPKAACVKCGKEFRTYPSWAEDGKKYCSAKCRGYTRRPTLPEYDCERCGVTFKHHGGGNTDSRFCSRRCANEIGRADYTCAVCDSIFRAPKSLSHRKNMFCSEDCKSAWKEKLRSGCRRGHLWSEHGVVDSRGKWRCRTCARERAREYYLRKKASEAARRSA